MLRQPITDIMTTNPDVVTDTELIRDAARLLRRRRFAGVPVVDGDGVLVGVLSFKDVLDELGTRKKGALLKGDPMHGFYVEGDVYIHDGSLALIDHLSGMVRDHMSNDLITLTIDDTVLDAVRVFADKGVHRVPVIDGDGDLVGLVTTADVMRHIAQTAS